MSSLPTWIKSSVTKINTDEGFTSHPETGLYAGAGYSVGVYPERERRVAFPITSALDLALELELYARLNHDVLRKPNHYIGGWQHSGQIILDIAVVTDSAVEAQRLGILNHQDAYYDFGGANCHDVTKTRVGGA